MSPNFVLGPVLIMIFSFALGWLPAGGWGTLSQLLMPAITLGALRAAYVARLARGGHAGGDPAGLHPHRAGQGAPRADGGARSTRSGWPCCPWSRYLGPATASILAGSVVVERIFNVPGLGTFFVNSAP